MRVTNSMISNSAQSHITTAKNSLLKYEEQYTTQKKIQRPSDDPTVAVRSLKLRSTYSQLTQYAEKNIKDAMNWMDTTESALTDIASTLTSMKSYLNQGACDYLEADDRTSVLSTLQQYVQSIFEDEANTDYSGRYVFTGYRTDTSLLFSADTSNLTYNITEDFTYDSLGGITVVTGGASYDSSVTDGQDYVDSAATTNTLYQIQLAYDNLSNASFPGTTDDPVSIDISYTDNTGATQTEALTVITRASTDTDAYVVGDDEVVYYYDTGEVLMGKDAYSDIQTKQASISINYNKSSFEKNDIRPEMYFECTCYNSVTGKTTKYGDPDGQEINYEVNYSQTITVNTQAKDAISTDIYRAIDYIQQTIEAVDEVEAKISEVETMISNTTDEDTLATLNSLKETLEDEKELRGSVMTEAFGMGLTMLDDVQQTLSVATSELGAKYNRAELTYNKLLDQQTDAEDKLSDNEDVEITDVYINLTQADNLYQASLSATAKILGNTLLDYI